ncbi:hypothetical protein [Streptomyces sp. NPDC049590]|uniref:hypothetical protein n=1 Tax=Streptomyces sp. NPDC049590 TaxID=3154834 RepID=UPI00343FD130
MTPNEKVGVAVTMLLFGATLVSILCGIAMIGLGRTKRESVMAGAAVWAALMGIFVPIIALFDFKAGGQPLILPQPPAATQTTQHATGWGAPAARPLGAEGAVRTLTMVSRH